MAGKCRKVDDEGRTVQSAWTEKYFFVEHYSKPVCLICQTSIAVMKEFNVKRHYETCHSKYKEYVGERRKLKIKNLKSGFEQQTNFFKKKQEESESVTKAALVVNSLIAKQMKPFTDAEFIKECTLAMVNEVCPGKKLLFDSIPLSARTVTRKVEVISENLKLQLKKKCTDFDYFSLAFDESTDACDTAQLAIFIRGITGNFDVIEEFAELISMKGTTRGDDIAQAILECTGRMQLDLSKFVSATTDGVPAMVGSHKGAIAVLQNHVASLGFSNTIIKLQCIIHQEVMASKVTHLDMTGLMSTVVKIINFVLARGLNHR